MTTVVTPDLYFSVGIDGFQEQPDGSLTVYGIPAQPATLDVDKQGVNPAWLKQALSRWYQTGPNLREMHQASAVGVGDELRWDGDTPHLTATVVDDNAIKKVRKKVYRAFSIGVKNHQLRNNPKYPGGEIVGGDIVEVSLVDRPAIPGSDILDFKGDLFKIASAVSEDEVLDHQQGVVWRRLGTVASLENEGAAMSKRADAEQVKRDMDPNVGGGVDRDKLPAEDFAGKHRSYPIDEPGDVSDAASSIGRAGDDNYSPEKLKENIIRIAHRKGAAYVAELPEAWKKEDKVADMDTEKTAEASAEKTVDADTETKAADLEEKTAETDVEKAPDAEAEKTVTAAEEKAARSCFCAECGKSVEIENGKTVEADGNSFLVGKDAAGHELRKFAGVAAEKKTVEPDEDEAAKAAQAEAEKASKSDARAALEHIDDVADKALGEPVDAHDDTKKTVAVSGDAADLLKAALADLLLDAGIDLGKVGRKMSKARLERLNSALDEMKSLAAELCDQADMGKAAQAGGDHVTRMQACLNEINTLARQMADPGQEGEDTDPGPSNMGAASGLNAKEMSLTRAAEPELTKSTDRPLSDTETVELLAKQVASTLEKAVGPLVERLEKVEHTVVPASPPVLHVEERGHAFVGKTAEPAVLTDDVKSALGKLSDADREKVAAALYASQRR